MTLCPLKLLRSSSRKGVAFHVLPLLLLRSTNTSQCLSPVSLSNDAPASHTPFDRTMGLLRTGPRPPRSPLTSSTGFDQVVPSSDEAVHQVSHSVIFFPALKKR